VILGDFNFHNSDIHVLNFYVWFDWVAPKNFNPMDNHHKFQKEQCICVGSTVLHMVHNEELWFLRVHWIGLKSGRCLQESKSIHIFKYLPSTLSHIFQYNFMPRPFLDTYMVGWWPIISWRTPKFCPFVFGSTSLIEDTFIGWRILLLIACWPFPFEQGVCRTVALPFHIKKYIIAKEDLWKLNYFTMYKYNLQKVL